jgi:hypothetical protein
VGPRGIVAAGIASLFGITLTGEGVPGAEYITPLVFMIVLGTVLLNATTARLVARLLGVIQDSSSGILIVGSSKASRVLAHYLQENGRHVIIIDNNESSVRNAENAGLQAFLFNIYTDDLNEKFELLDVGYLIAMTSSGDVNEYALRKYQKEFGEMGAYRLITSEEMTLPIEDRPVRGLFSYTDDYLNLNEVARDYPQIHELEMQSLEALQRCVDRMAIDNKTTPVFVKDPTGEIHIIPKDVSELDLGDNGFSLVYMGKKVEVDFEAEILKEKGEDVPEDQNMLHQ